MLRGGASIERLKNYLRKKKGMTIYSGSGDAGETSLYGGKRVAKASLRVSAYGDVDEANAFIGKAMTECSNVSQEFLSTVQQDLLKMGSDLAAPIQEVENTKLEEGFSQTFVRITVEDVQRLEKKMDEVDVKLLKPLRRFILPGGCPASASLHCARTVVRRAERSLAQLSKAEKINQFCLAYLNRLSDLLFVLARFENSLANVKEEEWVP